MNIVEEMLTMFKDNSDLLKNLITGEGSWVYGYDIETKAQWLQWKRTEELKPKKARQVRWNVKVLFTVSKRSKIFSKIKRLTWTSPKRC